MMTGNKCGHNPQNPQFFEPSEKHRLRPDVIQWAIKNLEKFYVKPDNWLISLKISRRSQRQERSEGRERDADVIGVLLHYTELASLRVGVPKENGEFLSLDMRFIAKKLGWRTDSDDEEDKQRLKEGGVKPRQKGIKRVWRAISALKDAGYLTVHRRYKKCLEGEQDYIGLPSVRCIQPKLFNELGIGLQKLRAKRDQAAKRLKKKYGVFRKKASLQFQQCLFTTKQKLSKGSHPRGRIKREQSRVVHHVLQEKQRMEQCYELRQLSENHQLSALAFYDKYPQLKPPS